MMIFVVVEFHPLNDVIAESDTDVGMRLDVTRRRGGAATHGEARHGVKPAGEVDFVRRSAPDPRPAESLPAAIDRSNKSDWPRSLPDRRAQTSHRAQHRRG